MGLLLNRKCCATCAYWGGSREVDSFGSHVRCKNGAETGVCQNPKSSFKKKETQADYGSCLKWEKWPLLKKMK